MAAEGLLLIITQISGLIPHRRTYTFLPPTGRWVLHGYAFICEHYQFSQEETSWRLSMRTMKEAAEFFVDFLIEDSEGRLVTCPSVSRRKHLPAVWRNRQAMRRTVYGQPDHPSLYSLRASAHPRSSALTKDSESGS